MNALKSGTDLTADYADDADKKSPRVNGSVARPMNLLDRAMVGRDLVEPHVGSPVAPSCRRAIESYDCRVAILAADAKKWRRRSPPYNSWQSMRWGQSTPGSAMNRAFSVGFGFTLIPEALPQAEMTTAPLALNRNLFERLSKNAVLRVVS